MTRFAPLVTVLAFFALPAQASGFFEDGNRLYEGCIPDGTKHVGTLRYIVGVVDGLNVSTQLGGKPGLCVPGGTSALQLNDVVCLWERNHPADRNAPGPYVVLTALQEAFPCR